jgi:polysaccharide chain length determinant protein (PEP-CTERM system associated)
MEELISQILTLAKGIWKYRIWALATSWIVLLIGSVVVYSMHNQYYSTARVFVDTESILKPLLAGMTSVPNVEQQVSIMSRTLLTRPNVEKVIRMVDLDLKSKSTKDTEALVTNLMSQIKIAGTVQNDIYTISYTAEDPKLVKDVVQAFLTIFVEGSFGDKKQDSAKAIRFINDQIKNYEQKLIAAETALKDFKLQNMGMLPKQGSDYGSKLSETSDILNQARLDLREAEQARNAIKNELASISPGVKSDGSAVIPEIDTRIEALNKNLDGLRLQYTEQHPDIVSAKRLIAQLEEKKREEAKNRKAGGDSGAGFSPMLQQYRISLATAEARVASMRARVDEYSSRVARLREMNVAAPAVEQQLAQLNRDYLINKENYEKLVTSRESAKLSGELSATTEMMTFRVIDPPTVPTTPTGPKRARLLSLVFAAALALGILAAILMSKVRPTFVSIGSLRDVTGMPILGSVGLNWTPYEQARQRRMVRYFGITFAALVVAYLGLLTPFLLKF